jgi:small-conductance mechanosensitive channel
LDAIADYISRTVGVPADVLARGLGTLAVIVLWFVIGRLSRRVISRTVDEASSRFHMKRVAGYVLAILSMILMARIWITGVTGIATYLGLLSAGLAIALQDPLSNIAGWLFILIRRPFRIGHRIQVGHDCGDVVDIRPFRFVMLEVGNWVHADQSTGRTLHVPNAAVFKHSIANYDEAFGHIWNEIDVTVTFESDWRAAKKALEAILEEHAEKIDDHIKRRIEAAAETLHLKFPTPTPVVWTTVVDMGVRLTMRYFCEPRRRRVSTGEIWEAVLDAFDQMDNVDFAYPTNRRFDNMSEGKPGARAQPRANVPPSTARD